MKKMNYKREQIKYKLTQLRQAKKELEYARVILYFLKKVYKAAIILQKTEAILLGFLYDRQIKLFSLTNDRKYYENAQSTLAWLESVMFLLGEK